MGKIRLLLRCLQLLRYLFPNNYLVNGSSVLQSRLSDFFISLLTVRKSPGEMTIQKLGKNNLDKQLPV